MKKNNLKFALNLFLAICLTLGISISLQSLIAAYGPPIQNPPLGNVKPPIFNDGGNPTLPTVNRRFTVNDNFYVGSDNFFVNNTTGMVGIGTTNPGHALEVTSGSINAEGGLIIDVRGSDPASPEVGQIWLIN